MNRAATRRAVGSSSSQCGTPSAHGDSSASGGTTPSSFCRARVRSRCTSHPSSNAPAYLLDPLGRDVERRVRRPEGEVAEERLVRRQRLLGRGHPVDGVVDEVLGEVVAVLGQPVGLDGRRAVVELGVPVVHLRAHEAVEPVEALTGRPAGERPRGVHLHRRRLVPLAERGGAVAVAAQDLRDRRGARRPVAGVAGLGRRHLRRDAHARPSGGCARSSAPAGSASTAR